MSRQDPNFDNAWGTAADHQISSESTAAFPTHDYTTTTYGDFSSNDSDMSSSNDFD